MTGRRKWLAVGIFRCTEFIHCVRTGKGGMGMLNAGLPNGQKLSDLSDKKLAKIFEEIDEDQSNSLSPLMSSFMQWKCGRSVESLRGIAGGSSARRCVGGGGFPRPSLFQRVRDAGRIGGFGQC